MFYHLIRPILFQVDAEMIHEITLWLLEHLGGYYPNTVSASSIEVLGLTCPNRIGLAAGFDKDGRTINFWERFGLGWIEVGTITPAHQKGHIKPRLFRVTQQQALLNRMGFNNAGANALVARLNAMPATRAKIGINIGKGKHTPIGEAVNDYSYCLEKLYHAGDYFVVNISSPNTQDLRGLHTKAFFHDLITALTMHRDQLAKQSNHYKPMLIKLSPDETDATYSHVVDCINHSKLDGLIISNTTTGRPNDFPKEFQQQAGGLSGMPLVERALILLRDIKHSLHKDKVIFSSGGLMNTEIVQERFQAGADVVQLYSGLIYNGLGWVKQLVTNHD